MSSYDIYLTQNMYLTKGTICISKSQLLVKFNPPGINTESSINTHINKGCG